MASIPSQNVAAFRSNAFLRSLSAADAALIAPVMVLAHSRSGDRIGIEGPVDALIHFPVTMVASIGEGSTGGRGLIGREGLIGWPAILGLDPEGCCGQVLFDGGTALTLPVRRMQVACIASSTLAMSLLRFVQSYTLQLSHMLRSSGSATLKQRLATCLLMLHDRLEGDTIVITHQLLAAHLGVRRASVTDSLHLLEGERVVRCDRRAIQIRDRTQLEGCAGAAYGSTENSYRRSIGPFGKSLPACTAPSNLGTAALV